MTQACGQTDPARRVVPSWPPCGSARLVHAACMACATHCRMAATKGQREWLEDHGEALLDLGRELVEQRLVRRGIDLALHDLAGALHGQRTDLLAQLVARALRHRGDVVLRRSLQPVDLVHRFAAGLL